LKNWIKSKFNWYVSSPSEEEYEECIKDLIVNKDVGSMRNFMQHGDTNTLEHCLNVSYYSYRMCKNFGLDFRAAARGGLLHDFFLYDWHKGKDYKGLHGLKHPKIALMNAEARFELSDKEKDIIKKHMWPTTIKLPKYKESFIVMMMDKYCAVEEVVARAQKITRRLKMLFGY
jgi:uncharacterized protein